MVIDCQVICQTVKPALADHDTCEIINSPPRRAAAALENKPSLALQAGAYGGMGATDRPAASRVGSALADRNSVGSIKRSTGADPTATWTSIVAANPDPRERGYP